METETILRISLSVGVKIDKYRCLGENLAVDINLGVKIDGNR